MRTLMQLVVMCVAGALVTQAQAQGGPVTRRRDAARYYTRQVARDYEPYMFAAVPLHAPVPVLRVLSPAPLAAPAPSALPPHRPRPYATSVQHTAYTRPYAERPYAEPAESRPYHDVRPYATSYSNTQLYGAGEPRPESRPYGASGSGSRPYVDAVELMYEPSGPAPAPAPVYSRGGARRPALPAAAASGELALEWDGYAVPLLPAGALARAPPSAPEESLSSAEVSVLYARPSPAGGYTYRKLPKKALPKKVASSKEQPVVVKIHKHKIIKS